MPKIRQPATLEHLAIAALADWITQIGDDIMPYIEKISRADFQKGASVLQANMIVLKNILDYNIPYMLFDTFAIEMYRAVLELTEKIKKSMTFRGSTSRMLCKVKIAVGLIEVLLTQKLTKLNMDEIPQIMRQFFYVNFSQLKGLTLLNLGSLSGGWKTSDMEPTIISGLTTLHKLRCLTIYYDCTDNILEAVSSKCPELRSIDVTSSKSITNQSVKYLINCPELRQVQLHRTGVTLEGFTRVLLNCHKIEDLGRCDELGRVLEYINLTNSEAGPFNLRKYVSMYATSTHLQLLVNLCPLIYSISVFHNSFLSDLMIIIGLSELSELKLLSCDFYGDQVKQVLELKGCNLTTLHLEHVDQLDLNSLMYISQFCPTLKSLTLYNCFLIQHTSLYTKKVNWNPFHSLQKLIYVCEGTDEQLIFLLGNCVNIRYIHLGTTVRTNDTVFDKIMDRNPFLFLEELRILKSEELTMYTVNRLLTGCVKLRVLAELECWVCLTEHDLEHIRTHVKINNLDLDITPLQRYRS